MKFSEKDKDIIRLFLDKTSKSGINGLSTDDELWALADDATFALINSILAINPADYGFNGQKLPLEPVPKDMVHFRNKFNNSEGEYHLDECVYLPQKVFTAFKNMSESFSNENPGRQMLVGSGYRSPAFQIVTLLYILANVYDFDISQTLKRVAMPAYSQHCSASKTAIDMLNIDGEPNEDNPQDFSKSTEYSWLIENARKFNFKESYPPDNPDGIMWEPWHWQFVDIDE